jgi:4-amino-4-deoxy-L-arabinose transferase-like glycosyltransferase
MVRKCSSALQLALLAAAVAVAVAAQLYVHHRPDAPIGWVLLISAALLVSFAGWYPAPSAEPIGTGSPQAALKVRRVSWGAATAVAVAATTVLSARSQWPVLPLVLWITGFLLGAAALRGWVVSPPGRAAPTWARREVAAVIAIVLLGAVARVVWIDSIPAFYFGDEARAGWSLVLTYRATIPNFFSMGWNTWPWIGISLQGLFGPFFGLTITTMRLSSALMGTLAIGATYLLVRELFTPRLAVLAALLFALCRTAIDFSRLGICHAQVMCYETLALFLWWRGVNTGRAASYWWAGVALGLCLYTYNAGELAPVLWVGWVAVSVAAAPRTLRTHWRAALITFAAMVSTMLPYLYYATDHLTFGNNWDQFTGMARRRQTLSQMLEAWHAGNASGAATILKRQVWLTWLGFGVSPSGGYQELNYRGGGMLDDVTAVLFVIGLAMALSKWRRAREGFVLYWWIVTVIVGGVLTIDPPAIVRLVGLLPAVALLAALPLDGLLRVSAETRARATASLALVAVLLAGAAWINWHTYFVEFANAPFADTESALGRRIERLPPGSTAFSLGSNDSMTFFNEIFHFNYPGRRLQDVPDPAHLLPLHQPVTFPVALILGPTQATLASYARTLYPHTDITDDIFAPERRLRFRELQLKPEDVTAQIGLKLTAIDSSNAVVAQMTGDPFDSNLIIPNTAAHLQWQGRIYWPTDHPVTLTVHAKRPVQVRVADGPVARVDGAAPADVVLDLPRGWLPLTITETAASERALSMAIKTPGSTRTLTAWDLNPNSTPEGLMAVYQRDSHALLRVIDPQLNAFAFTEEPAFEGDNAPMVHLPFSVSWSGALRITIPGTYGFEARGTGTYSVSLDDGELFNALAPSGIPNQLERAGHAERNLSTGTHRLEAHWTCPLPPSGRGRLFQLYWAPPGGERELIPPSAFVPVATAASDAGKSTTTPTNK